MAELFSRKFGLKKTSQGLFYGTVPQTARTGLFQITFNALGPTEEGRNRYQALYVFICQTLRISWNWSIEQEFQFAQVIEKLILNCEWYQFFEICQIVYFYLVSLRGKNTFGIDPNKYLIEINGLFRDEFLGFELKEGDIEKIGNPVTDAKIKEARILLKEPELKGADQQFEKAVKYFNVRPNPDTENCIKDAVGAIEAVGRILTGNEKAELDDIISEAVKKGVIPKPLDQTFIKLNAYRGNEPGVAHGATGELKDKIDEAELILSMSAAMIIYLVKKRSKLS